MRLKHFFILLFASVTIGLVGVRTVNGQGSMEIYLRQIAENTMLTASNTMNAAFNLNGIFVFTGGILEKLNGVPEYIIAMGKFIEAWITPMKAEENGSLNELQQSITKFAELLTQGQAEQLKLMPGFNLDLLGNDGKNVFNFDDGKESEAKAPGKDTLWYANDLTYSSILDKPYFAKDPRNQDGKPKVDFAKNYVRNVSGVNIYHITPDPSWEDSDARTRYQSYYNTVMAVQSFNAYVLSNQLVEKDKLNELQKTLVTQASDPGKWIAKVATEHIGHVLRQLLLYQSQVYVFMTQMLQLQKQMVAAQAMTNATLIAVNQMNEGVMAANAQQVQPTV